MRRLGESHIQTMLPQLFVGYLDVLANDGAFNERAEPPYHRIVDCRLSVAAPKRHDECHILQARLAMVIPAELIKVAREHARVELKMRPVKRNPAPAGEVPVVTANGLPLLELVARFLLFQGRFLHRTNQRFPILSRRIPQRGLQARREIVGAAERRHERTQARRKLRRKAVDLLADPTRRDRRKHDHRGLGAALCRQGLITIAACLSR
jgi:hypothetical protein